jgi:hypothetical protein
MVWNNNNNLALAQKNDIVNHPYIMFSLGFFSIAIVVYVLYKYNVSGKPKQGYTYYSDDLLKMDNLFSETVSSVEDCQKKCEEQPNCKGITYESDSNTCIGQEYGRLRTDKDNYYAWVKPTSVSRYNVFDSSEKRLKSGKDITGYLKSDTRASLNSSNIPIPPLLDQFTFSFWLVIQDWYSNFSYWRHIFHKGTPIDSSKNSQQKTLVYYNWEKLSNDFPEQVIGVWLTPFQNNLRIAVTTTSHRPYKRVYPHAHIKKCKCDESGAGCKCWTTDQTGDPEHLADNLLDKKEFTHTEYLDVQDISSSIPNHIVISIKNNILTVYLNAKEHKSIILKGKPKWNNGDLYMHNPKSYQGILQDFKYFPNTLDLDLVKYLYDSGKKTISTK